MNEVIDFLWFSGDYIAANPMLLPAVATGAASLFSTLFTNRANKKRQEEMNEYNSPAAQLERYKKAGINPGYGQGLGAGNQSSFPSAVAPDVSAAIEPAAKYMSLKLQNQSLKNAQLENNRLAETVKTARLNNAILEQTLPTRVDAVKTQLETSKYNLYNVLREKVALMEHQKKLTHQKEQIAFKQNTYTEPLLRLKQDFSAIQNMLSTQKWNLNELMNPLQYQLGQQKLEQLNVTNPLEALIMKMKAFGMNQTDPLLLRMIAPGVVGNGEFDSNPLLPYAVPFSFGKGMLDMFKNTKGMKFKK